MATSPKRVGVLSELSADEVEILTRACVERTYAAGDIIIADGALADGLFIVTAGIASVLEYSGSNVEIELARLHAGEHFGEMSLVTERPASASVRARTAVMWSICRRFTHECSRRMAGCSCGFGCFGDRIRRSSAHAFIAATRVGIASWRRVSRAPP